MGYFDALTSGSFKTDDQGRRLFFPWGALGRGYIIASEQDYERLRGRVKAFLIVSFIPIIGAIVTRQHIVAFAVVAVFCVAYVVWINLALRGLHQSDERLTVTESMTTQARTHNPVILWFGLIASLVFVAMGVFLLAVDPDGLWIALAVMAFFGLCAGVFVRMIILRRG